MQRLTLAKAIAQRSISLLLFLAIVATAHAGESPFGFIYTTDTQPKGTFELEQWATLRKGKQQGNFDLWQHRTEIEYGVTNNFQASLYLNNYSVNANGSSFKYESGASVVSRTSES